MVAAYGEAVRACPFCGELFPEDAPRLWHCPICAHHWPMEKLEHRARAFGMWCPNCSRAAPRRGEVF